MEVLKVEKVFVDKLIIVNKCIVLRESLLGGWRVGGWVRGCVGSQVKLFEYLLTDRYLSLLVNLIFLRNESSRLVVSKIKVF